VIMENIHQRAKRALGDWAKGRKEAGRYVDRWRTMPSTYSTKRGKQKRRHRYDNYTTREEDWNLTPLCEETIPES